MDATFTPFTPPAHQIDDIIDALGSPDNTLREVANHYKTTIEALTLWMTRPDIARRLDNIQSAVARRTRLIATNFLPGVVRLLNSIIDHYHDDAHEREPQPLAPEPRRHRENARKAAALIFRLAKFFDSPTRGHRDPPPNPPSPPAPITPPDRTHRSPSLDASMPHALLPSSTSSFPGTSAFLGTSALRADPSVPLPTLAARASSLCASPPTSSCTSALRADPSALLPTLLTRPSNPSASTPAPQPPCKRPTFQPLTTKSAYPLRSPPPSPNPPHLRATFALTPQRPAVPLWSQVGGDSKFQRGRERRTPAQPGVGESCL